MDITKEREWENLYSYMYGKSKVLLGRVKEVVDWWNETQPNLYASWEWVETMVMSRTMYNKVKNCDIDEAERQLNIMDEMICKLPAMLVEYVWREL